MLAAQAAGNGVITDAQISDELNTFMLAGSGERGWRRGGSRLPGARRADRTAGAFLGPPALQRWLLKRTLF
jgi:hypothetical protein